MNYASQVDKKKAADARQENFLHKAQTDQMRSTLSTLIKSGTVETIIKFYVKNGCREPACYDTAMNYIAQFEKHFRRRIYFPENEQRVENWLAEFFGFDDSAQLKRADADLSMKIHFTVQSFRDWRGGRLCMSAIGEEEKYSLSLAGQLVYKSLEPKLSPAQKAKKREAFKLKYDLWEPEALREALHAFLQANRKEEFTQDDLATEFCAKSTFVYHRLQELVANKNTIISYTSKRYARTHPNYKKESAVVYKYAPERVAITQDYANIDTHVQGLLVRCITKHPGYSQNQIVIAMYEVLGQIDEKIVRRNLQALVGAGKIARRAARLKNAVVFYLPEVAPPLPEVIEEPAEVVVEEVVDAPPDDNVLAEIIAAPSAEEEDSVETRMRQWRKMNDLLEPDAAPQPTSAASTDDEIMF